MNDDNWDLFAVVRGCSAAGAAASSSATTAATTVFSAAAAAASASSYHQNPIFLPVSVEQRHGYPNTNGVFGELRDLYSPFLQEPSASVSVSSFSCLNYNEEQQSHQRQPQNKRPLSASVSSSSVTSRSTTTSNTSKSKRRKMQQKKVCHVPAEALNNDVWAWRKYGQKPIKGSPYPRGYYRCSTSKGCLARKQVERNRSDPTMFIVTYTAEHNHPAPTHRNSLAGSTRQKPTDQPPAVSAAAVTDCTKSPATTTTTTTTTTATSTSAAGAACSSSSPVTSADNFAFPVGNFDRDDDLLSLSDTVVSDDFFDGLEDFAVGDSFSGSSPACYDLSWMADNAAATAGGI